MKLKTLEDLVYESHQYGYPPDKLVNFKELHKWAIKHVKALEPKIDSIRFKSLEDKKLNVKYWSLVTLRDWIKENFNLKETDLE